MLQSKRTIVAESVANLQLLGARHVLYFYFHFEPLLMLMSSLFKSAQNALYLGYLGGGPEEVLNLRLFRAFVAYLADFLCIK